MTRMARTSLMQRVQAALRSLAVVRTDATQSVGMTRRQLLQSGGLMSAGMIAARLPHYAPRNSTIGARIAIVGAGLAGLNCAYRLATDGYGPSVYEAANRVGGRTFSAVNVLGDGLVTEIGGEFINSDHADMLALVEAFGLELLDRTNADDTLTDEAVYFAGRRISESELAALFMPYAERIAADVEAVLNEDEVAFATFDAMTIAEYFAVLGIDSPLYDFLEVAFTTENGLAITEQNALNFLYLAPAFDEQNNVNAVAPSDERYKVRGGNQQICVRAAEAVASLGGTVTLEHRLTGITQADTVYTLIFDTPDGEIRVEAEWVVLAMPFTVLRTIDMQLENMSEDHRKAIDTLGYGTNGKLMVGMDERVWNTQGYSGYVYTDQRFQSGWDSSELQATPTGSYTFFNGGAEGVRFGDEPLKVVTEAYVSALDAVFAGANTAFNGSVIRQVWATEPLARGSYSCPLPNQYALYEIMSEPMGGVYLAGEHTSDAYFGYMNGAAQSGRRVYEALLERLNA